MKIFIKTYGCQMNERDSEALGALLVAAGHSLVDSEDCADVLIFNTCSVREQAERKAIGKMLHMKKLKAANPDLVIGAVGCMAQRAPEELLRKIPHLDFVLGTGQLHRVTELVEAARAGRRKQSEVAESAEVLDKMSGHLKGRGGCFGEIAITRGCNRFCSYCIVPYVRGREISRGVGDIVAEARQLVADGVREILLLGQNVAAYGWGGRLTPPPDELSPFAELLEELQQIDGLLRIRFTSPYPTYFNARLIQAMRDCTKVCRNVHLPLQSGSDRILRAMNRQYNAAEYLAIVDRLREALPGVTFSTDVIVGFPGEEREDFDATRELMRRVGFDNAFIFKYSPRPGAKSAGMEDVVSPEVKLERNKILLDDLKLRVAEALKLQLGTEQEVLVEGPSPRNCERWCGRTGENRVVHFEPDASTAAGTLRRVRILRAGAVSLSGELL